jgi:vacuolar-type H+-ATPase subunit F/Vma7
MVKIAVAGGSEFIVGFELAGIKDTFELGKNAYGEIMKIKDNKDLGIVVIEEKIMDEMDSQDRVAIEDSVEPVFIPVSTKVEQDSLKRLIKKSVGVDLWK